jgi:hypothetical protein
LQLRFKAKDIAGTANIQVTHLVIADGDGVETQIGGAAHTVEVSKPTMPGDFNDDNRVSVGDLALVAKAYGMTSDSPNWNEVKRYDINNDGIIDIEDLAAVARLILKN